jgi:hypothetical protein
MEKILDSIPNLDEEDTEKLITLEQIKLIDSSLDETNPMTFVIYLENNRKFLSEKDIETTLKIIEKLKYNQHLIAKKNIAKMVQEIDCNEEKHIEEVVRY